MKLTFVLIVVVLLTVDSPLTHAQSSSSILNALKDNINQLNTLRNEVVNSLRGLLSAANATVDTVIGTMNETMNNYQDEIDSLRKQYAGPLYDKCFVGRPVVTFFDHTVDGVVNCINLTISKTAQDAKNVISSIDTLLVTVNSVPDKVVECGIDVECLLKFSAYVTITVPAAVIKIGVSVTSIVARLCTLQSSFAPCIAMQANFLKWAESSVYNVRMCLESVVAQSGN